MPTAAGSPGRASRRRPHLWAAAGVAAVLVCLVSAWLYLRRAPTPPSGVTIPSLELGFERGTERFAPERATPGCLGVRRSVEVAHRGEGSLEIQMYLDGEVAERQNGEAWVDLRKVGPNPSGSTPIDLSGRAIVAWVYAPDSALGDPSRPNGFQLFVKDEQYRTLSGDWQNATPDEWSKLTVRLPVPGVGGGLLPTFRPDRVVSVGIRMAIGAGSSALFDGSVHLDSVGW